jgi:hypothetical protein
MTISATSQGLKPGVCTSSNRPANPFDGMVIYMTDVDQSAVWDGTSWVGYAPVAGNRNKIINGAFNIWQRGTSFSTSGSYASDRWLLQVDGSGATRAVGQQSFTVGNPIAGYEPKFYLRYNQSVAGTGATFNILDQRIEDVRTLAGQQVVVSFWAKADTTRTINSSIQQVFDGSAEVAGLSSGTLTLSTSWARYSYTGTLASIAGKTIGANSYAALRFNLPLNSTFVIDIWGVQLEAGAVATPFEFEDAQVTLAKCQRYFEKSYNIGTTPGTASTLDESIGLGIYTNTPAIYNRFGSGVSFKVPKRATPTVVQYAPATGSTAAASNATSGDGSTAVGYVSAQQVNQNGFNLAASVGGSTSTGYFTIFIAYTASAEL